MFQNITLNIKKISDKNLKFIYLWKLSVESNALKLLGFEYFI